MPGPVDVVLGVKALHRAKTRLAVASAGVAAPGPARERAHQELALALAADTLAAVRASGVRRVVVVSSDPRVRALADDLADGGDRFLVVDDPGRGLDAALRHGAAVLRARADARGDAPAAVAALPADLPALRAAELDAALAAALDPSPRAGLEAALGAGPGPGDTAGRPAAFVADHVGTGTTLLVTPAGREPHPRFGPGSAAAHAAVGAVALTGRWPGLRLDVDTPEDLRRARELGTGPATAAWPGTSPVDDGGGPAVGGAPIARHGCDV